MNKVEKKSLSLLATFPLCVSLLKAQHRSLYSSGNSRVQDEWKLKATVPLPPLFSLALSPLSDPSLNSSRNSISAESNSSRRSSSAAAALQHHNGAQFSLQDSTTTVPHQNLTSACISPSIWCFMSEIEPTTSLLEYDGEFFEIVYYQPDLIYTPRASATFIMLSHQLFSQVIQEYPLEDLFEAEGETELPFLEHLQIWLSLIGDFQLFLFFRRILVLSSRVLCYFIFMFAYHIK